MNNEWRYYNHALVPNCAPHEEENLFIIEGEKIPFKEYKRALLARWTTDFDCGYNTNWWFVILDKPFNIENLPARKRYKINKASKYFDVKLCDPRKYIDDLYEVTVDAQNSYPKKNKNIIKKEFFNDYIEEICNKKIIKVYIAFFKETNEVVGYSIIPTFDNWCELQTQKAKPAYEKYGLNAALLYALITDNSKKLEEGNYYICDGARNINHETNFQNYLEENFGFRKAYCKLHIVYNKKIKWIIKLLFPFRNIFVKFDSFKRVHLLNSLLKMEEYRR